MHITGWSPTPSPTCNSFSLFLFVLAPNSDESLVNDPPDVLEAPFGLPEPAIHASPLQSLWDLSAGISPSEALGHLWNCDSTVITLLPVSVQDYLLLECHLDVVQFSVMQDEYESASVLDGLRQYCDIRVCAWDTRRNRWGGRGFRYLHYLWPSTGSPFVWYQDEVGYEHWLQGKLDRMWAGSIPKDWKGLDLVDVLTLFDRI